MILNDYRGTSANTATNHTSASNSIEPIQPRIPRTTLKKATTSLHPPAVVHQASSSSQLRLSSTASTFSSSACSSGSSTKSSASSATSSSQGKVTVTNNSKLQHSLSQHKFTNQNQHPKSGLFLKKSWFILHSTSGYLKTGIIFQNYRKLTVLFNYHKGVMHNILYNVQNN